MAKNANNSKRGFEALAEIKPAVDTQSERGFEGYLSASDIFKMLEGFGSSFQAILEIKQGAEQVRRSQDEEAVAFYEAAVRLETVTIHGLAAKLDQLQGVLDADTARLALPGAWEEMLTKALNEGLGIRDTMEADLALRKGDPRYEEGKALQAVVEAQKEADRLAKEENDRKALAEKREVAERAANGLFDSLMDGTHVLRQREGGPIPYAEKVSRRTGTETKGQTLTPEKVEAHAIGVAKDILDREGKGFNAFKGLDTKPSEFVSEDRWPKLAEAFWQGREEYARANNKRIPRRPGQGKPQAVARAAVVAKFSERPVQQQGETKKDFNRRVAIWEDEQIAIQEKGIESLGKTDLSPEDQALLAAMQAAQATES
jgi:hypothetical protein